MVIPPPPKEDREEYTAEIRSQIEELRNDPNSLLIATDGSRRRVDSAHPRNPNRHHSILFPRRRIRGHKHAGAGIHARHEQTVAFERSFGLGQRSSAFDGESFAIAAGMNLASRYCKTHTNINRILILSDSSSALQNITRTNPHPTQFLCEGISE